MKSLEYGDEKISEKEILIAIPSMVIGVGILSLPRRIADETIGSDGWIALVIAGAVCVLMIWLMAKLAARFPHQSFISYASIIVSKPIAKIITFLFAVLFISIAAFHIRVLGDTSQQYLFNQTPVEVVTLSFLLVVVYAVSGARAALFRLNMLFFPFIIFILLLVLIFNFRWIEPSNLLPVFQTNVKDYWKGIQTSTLSYMGFSIVLFYTAFARQPKKAPKIAVLGMTIPIVIYVFVYLTCLMVFGQISTSNLLFPTIDLAKRIELPGGILESVESVFFVVWTMGAFTTTAMALDVSILALSYIFNRMKKIGLVLILSPIVYYIALLPRDISQISLIAGLLGTIVISYSFLTTLVLFLIAKLRGVGRNDKTSA
ncbi:GerAB/ArcD/ProY family transporter [Ornithinibacillus californiensis]|uniref:GerAB/ArcD/ProY family transporter n=1 Tax=Ornithinibacillus californiensis TaxID=161536 RepID=UPI00064DFFB3|nr:GerAB/ArcD/ProY family transporter [Ornithinibacillus californiensis]